MKQNWKIVDFYLILEHILKNPTNFTLSLQKKPEKYFQGLEFDFPFGQYFWVIDLLWPDPTFCSPIFDLLLWFFFSL